jgi:hypothetical protein
MSRAKCKQDLFKSLASLYGRNFGKNSDFVGLFCQLITLSLSLSDWEASKKALKMRSLFLFFISIFWIVTFAQSSINSVSPYQYVGCWTDTGNPRSFYYQQTFNAPVTIEHCVSLCQSQGYTYAGVEYYREVGCNLGIFPTLVRN